MSVGTVWDWSPQGWPLTPEVDMTPTIKWTLILGAIAIAAILAYGQFA